MIETRIQYEEMEVYYFIAKKILSDAKLGFLGIMAGTEERELNNIFNSWNSEEIDKLETNLLNAIEKKKSKFSIKDNFKNIKETEELISTGVSYTLDILFKPKVLENVKNNITNSMSNYDKLVFCVNKICDTKRMLIGLNEYERNNILDGKDFELASIKNNSNSGSVTAVDSENVNNITEVNVNDKNIEVEENTIDTSLENKQESINTKVGFTSEDVPSEPVNNMLKEKEEEIEILTFDDED